MPGPPNKSVNRRENLNRDNRGGGGEKYEQKTGGDSKEKRKTNTPITIESGGTENVKVRKKKRGGGERVVYLNLKAFFAAWLE